VSETAARWIVSGRVQGVGFRWFAVRLAEEIGVSGWVTNLPDGRVEVVARGTVEALSRVEEGLRTGPRGARVESVEKSDIPRDAVDAKSFGVR
jgi:acylphosphatase